MFFDFLLEQKPKTGTEIVNEVIGQFESIQNKLENGISLIEDDIAVNEEKIAKLGMENTALADTKHRASKAIIGLKAIFGG
jgi:hypothetical protein